MARASTLRADQRRTYLCTGGPDLGTVLVKAEAERRLKSVKGEGVRVLTLLSTAYGEAVDPSVLGNIERAAKCWREGDDCLAYIHLAHAGLRELHDAYEAARRLFIADTAINAGASSRAVLEALNLCARYVDTVEKLYNPDEPRVPAGSGRISGQWTRLLSWIGELDVAQVAELGAYDRPDSDRGKPYKDDWAKQYEDFLKQLINPPPNGPTPSGFVYYLPNPAQNGKPVSYDDCEKVSATLFEFKAEQYARLLTFLQSRELIEEEFLDQSGRQIAASGGRPLVWIFAELEAALFTRKLFDAAKEGREALQLFMCLGRGGSSNDGDGLSLLHTFWLVRTRGPYCRHRREVLGDA